MKKLVPCLLILCVAAVLTGCESTASHDHSNHESASPAATGQKCAVCGCKGYNPGRIIKGVCQDCGHTMAEHTTPAK